MKRALVILLIATVLGALVGTLMFRDPGYILVSYGDYAVETSLWFGLIALLALYFGLRFVVWLMRWFARGSGRLSAWKARRQHDRALRETTRGMVLLGEGRWEEARKALLRNVGSADTPLVNYLGAARAADALGDDTRRDELLKLAHESTPGSQVAVGLEQARLQIEHGLFEQAAAALVTLRAQAPGNPRVLERLATCHHELGDWEALRALLPDLKKTGAIAPAAFPAFEKETWLEVFDARLKAARGPGTEPAARALWDALPRDLRKDPEIVDRYAQLLEAEGDAAEAEAVLRATLNKDWHDLLVDRYGRLAGADVARQRVAAERWLKDRPNDATLQLALGRLSLRANEWATAREYLEAALKHNRSSECYAELGRLCHALGDHTRGSELLALSVTGLPDLPLPGVVREPSARREGEHV